MAKADAGKKAKKGKAKGKKKEKGDVQKQKKTKKKSKTDAAEVTAPVSAIPGGSPVLAEAQSEAPSGIVSGSNIVDPAFGEPAPSADINSAAGVSDGAASGEEGELPVGFGDEEAGLEPIPPIANYTINLKSLTSNEESLIRTMLTKDAAIDKLINDKVSVLRQEIKKLNEDALPKAKTSKLKLQTTCVRCKSSGGILGSVVAFVTSRARCQRCRFNVCGSCRTLQSNGKWLCSLCVRYREINYLTGGWSQGACAGISGSDVLRISLKEKYSTPDTDTKPSAKTVAIAVKAIQILGDKSKKSKAEAGKAKPGKAKAGKAKAGKAKAGKAKAGKAKPAAKKGKAKGGAKKGGGKKPKGAKKNKSKNKNTSGSSVYLGVSASEKKVSLDEDTSNEESSNEDTNNEESSNEDTSNEESSEEDTSNEESSDEEEEENSNDGENDDISSESNHSRGSKISMPVGISAACVERERRKMQVTLKPSSDLEPSSHPRKRLNKDRKSNEEIVASGRPSSHPRKRLNKDRKSNEEIVASGRPSSHPRKRLNKDRKSNEEIVASGRHANSERSLSNLRSWIHHVNTKCNNWDKYYIETSSTRNHFVDDDDFLLNDNADARNSSTSDNICLNNDTSIINLARLTELYHNQRTPKKTETFHQSTIPSKEPKYSIYKPILKLRNIFHKFSWLSNKNQKSEINFPKTSQGILHSTIDLSISRNVNKPKHSQHLYSLDRLSQEISLNHRIDNHSFLKTKNATHKQHKVIKVKNKATETTFEKKLKKVLSDSPASESSESSEGEIESDSSDNESSSAQSEPSSSDDESSHVVTKSSSSDNKSSRTLTESTTIDNEEIQATTAAKSSNIIVNEKLVSSSNKSKGLSRHAASIVSSQNSQKYKMVQKMKYLMAYLLNVNESAKMDADRIILPDSRKSKNTQERLGSNTPTNSYGENPQFTAKEKKKEHKKHKKERKSKKESPQSEQPASPPEPILKSRKSVQGSIQESTHSSQDPSPSPRQKSVSFRRSNAGELVDDQIPEAQQTDMPAPGPENEGQEIIELPPAAPIQSTSLPCVLTQTDSKMRKLQFYLCPFCRFYCRYGRDY